MIARILAVAHARNIEFLRDRSVLVWNLVLPIMLAIGLAMVFSGPERALFKVAVIASPQVPLDDISHPFLDLRYIDFYAVENNANTVRKLERHQHDLLFDATVSPARYWINEKSRAGYLVEKLLHGTQDNVIRQTVSGDAVRYIDWLFPGIVGMNMMFSALFGVGYVVVRYRKSGFLKRLSATPLRPVEFIVAQIFSRLLLVLVTTSTIFLLGGGLLGVRMEGSYVLLLTTLLLSASALISIGFLISARVTSEELAGGLLNLLSWPMMVLSGVWFSMEGRAPWLHIVSDMLPLTHFLKATRAIMLDGAGLSTIAGSWAVLAAITMVCLLLGSLMFRWRES